MTHFFEFEHIFSLWKNLHQPHVESPFIPVWAWVVFSQEVGNLRSGLFLTQTDWKIVFLLWNWNKIVGSNEICLLRKEIEIRTCQKSWKKSHNNLRNDNFIVFTSNQSYLLNTALAPDILLPSIDNTVHTLSYIDGKTIFLKV